LTMEACIYSRRAGPPEILSGRHSVGWRLQGRFHTTWLVHTAAGVHKLKLGFDWAWLAFLGAIVAISGKRKGIWNGLFWSSCFEVIRAI